MTTAAIITQAHKTARTLRGVAVTYARLADSVELTAIPGDTSQQLDDGDVDIEAGDRDYIVLRAELVLDSAAVLPERGDTITEVDGTLTHTYEVLADDAGAVQWRYADPMRQQIRISTRHTKTVSTA